jgi:AcrR family transcriptional regulator
MVTRRTSLAGISDEGISEKLLSVAREMCFARKGYDRTSVQEIVAAAGVTKPVLYYYFRNKEGLYLELLREPSLNCLYFLMNSQLRV